MSSDFIDRLAVTLENNLAARASQLLGEPEPGTRAALRVTAPAIVAALVHEGASTENADRLLALIRSAPFSTGLGDDIMGILRRRHARGLADAGIGFAERLFHTRHRALVEGVAKRSRIGTAAVSHLLEVAIIVGFSVLRARFLDDSSSAIHLSRILARQRAGVAARLDPRVAHALAYAWLAPLPPIDEAAERALQAATEPPPAPKDPLAELSSLPIPSDDVPLTFELAAFETARDEKPADDTVTPLRRKSPDRRQALRRREEAQPEAPKKPTRLSTIELLQTRMAQGGFPAAPNILAKKSATERVDLVPNVGAAVALAPSVAREAVVEPAPDTPPNEVATPAAEAQAPAIEDAPVVAPEPTVAPEPVVAPESVSSETREVHATPPAVASPESLVRETGAPAEVDQTPSAERVPFPFADPFVVQSIAIATELPRVEHAPVQMAPAALIAPELPAPAPLAEPWSAPIIAAELPVADAAPAMEPLITPIAIEPAPTLSSAARWPFDDCAQSAVPGWIPGLSQWPFDFDRADPSPAETAAPVAPSEAWPYSITADAASVEPAPIVEAEPVMVAVSSDAPTSSVASLIASADSIQVSTAVETAAVPEPAPIPDAAEPTLVHETILPTPAWPFATAGADALDARNDAEIRVDAARVPIAATPPRDAAIGARDLPTTAAPGAHFLDPADTPRGLSAPTSGAATRTGGGEGKLPWTVVPFNTPKPSSDRAISRWWLVPTLVVGGVVALLILSYRAAVDRQVEAPSPQVVKVEAEQVATKAVPLKSVDLPGGQKLDAPEGGLIASLSAYLSEPDAPAGKAFVMEAVSFERDSATLAPTSENQLRQLADVLSAYPRVKVRVEGHTDVSGDTATVRALSAERAATIKAALIMAGVADERIQSQGFGAERPLTKEQTAAAKASNRRVELVIAER